jgi:hypothetical protein
MKIDSLTCDQEKLLANQINYWLRLAHSNEPLDRPAATRAICAMYEALGKPRPAVLFFSSPMMCVLGWGALRALREPRSQLEAQLWSQLQSQLGSQLQSQLQSQLESQLGSGLGSGLELALRSELMLQRSELESQLRQRLESQLALQLRSQLRSQLVSALGSQLEAQLASQVWSQLASQVWSQLASQRWSQTLSQLASQLRSQLNGLAGSWLCGWNVYYDFCARIGVTYTQQQEALLRLWTVQSQQCHWWFPYEGTVLASDRPRVLTVDSSGRLHNERGPALEYSDGYALYAWHGLRVERELIMEPIAIEQITVASNAELRRVMIERYGWRRYVIDSGAQVIDHVPDTHELPGLRGARLLRMELPGEPEPIIYLDMINSTPEPDGTFKHYLERIDPKAYDGDAGRLCHAAMASRWHYRDENGQLQRSFVRWQDYQPSRES